MNKLKKYLFFVPHQDDELLTMGIAINKYTSEGNEVYVVLCTDGSKSRVREKLNNGKKCQIHDGTHCYPLSIEEFVQARDKEFCGSCISLGINTNNIHIYQNRYIDGSLTKDNCIDIINYYLKLFGDNVVVCTISPNNGNEQHSDHIVLGEAAEELLKNNIINELHLFIEPYLYDKIKDNQTIISQMIHTLKPKHEDCIYKAIESYSTWNPKEKQYAIGYHSVGTAFNTYKQDLTNYYIIKKKQKSQSKIDKIKKSLIRL